MEELAFREKGTKRSRYLISSDHQLLMETLTIKLHKTKFWRPRQHLHLNSETASRPSRKNWLNPTFAFSLLDSERSRRRDPCIQRRLHSASNMGQDLRKTEDEGQDKLNKSERVKDCFRKKYQDLDKEVNRMAKRDRKDYIKNLALRKLKWLQHGKH